MFEHHQALTSYQSACELLMSEGLPCPPIPKKFTNMIRQTRHSAIFSSAPSLPDPYHFLFYLNRLLSGENQPLAVFGCSGHGLSSKAMHYYLIDEHIAVLLQDGLPNDPGNWRVEQEQDYDAVSQICIACQDAVLSQKLKVDEKLVICRSFFEPNQWGVIKKSGDKVIWHLTDNPIQASVNWLLS